MFKFSKGNSKLGKHILIFNISAGITCPGADKCFAFAKELPNGKRVIVDGPNMEFRCFAACSEAMYPAVFNARKHNLDTVKNLLKQFPVGVAGKMFSDDLRANMTKNTTHVRIHESGDFYSADYFAMWMHVARLNKDLTFYAYSKNLPMILEYGMENLPSNFYITASKGGRFDHLIDEGFFSRYSVVVLNDAEASVRGLEVDHDDSHCYGPEQPFALLVHGNQPAGSVHRQAIQARKKAGEFVGYSK